MERGARTVLVQMRAQILARRGTGRLLPSRVCRDRARCHVGGVRSDTNTRGSSAADTHAAGDAQRDVQREYT